jgi:uncharacterized alkaline shock family protein YloU
MGSPEKGVQSTDYRIAASVLESIVRGALAGDGRLRVPATSGFMRGRAVEVAVSEDSARVFLSLEARFGEVMPALGTEAQALVSQALSSMTGLRVEAVDVQFVGVLPPGAVDT